MSVTRIDLPHNPEEENQVVETKQPEAKILPFKVERRSAKKGPTAGDKYEQRLGELRARLENELKDKAGTPLGKRIEEALGGEITTLENKLKKYHAAQEKIVPLKSRVIALNKETSSETQKSLSEIKTTRSKKNNVREVAAINETTGEFETKTAPTPKLPKEKVVLTPAAVFSTEEEAWFKQGEELEKSESMETLPTSLEPYLAAIKKMNTTDFDFPKFEQLVRRQHQLEEEMVDIESGTLKVGFFKRWGMQRKLYKITDTLRTFQEKIDEAETVRMVKKGLKPRPVKEEKIILTPEAVFSKEEDEWFKQRSKKK